MKHFYAVLFILLAAVTLTAFAPDGFLLPESFYLHKGDKLSVHLLVGDNFSREGEDRFNSKKTTKFTIYDGSKATDLVKVAKDSAAPVLDHALQNSGLALIGMSLKPEVNEMPHEDFVTYLGNQGYDNLVEKIKDDTRLNLTEKYSYYLKTLVSVDDRGGSNYNKVLGDELEIVLKSNPYKKSYGDDISAQLLFQGKPMKDTNLGLYIRSSSGNVHKELYKTDASGLINFSPSRDGIYMLRAVTIEPSKSNDADFETRVATYTFAFSSRDEMPNTYKEFGFGDKH